jgi:hypothetical protein
MMSPQERELRAKLKELRDHTKNAENVTRNAENVGREASPEEARKMHYGETEHRSIYGEASLYKNPHQTSGRQDAKELARGRHRVPPAADAAGRAELTTGCVGYVTDATYGKLLDAMDRTPWIVSFVLRMFPFEPLAETFAKRGLVTEKLHGATFVQRRFRDPTSS